MKTLTIANLSGGRGKTWVTRVLAHSLMEQHKKHVLIIDLDYLIGSNISSHFLTRDQILSPATTILDALVNTHALPQVVHSNLSIFVGNETLDHADQVISHQDTLLRTLLQNYDTYDYCLIDCNPKLNSLTRNALVAANSVLVPIWVHRSSIDFDVAEQNVTITLDQVRKLKSQHLLPIENVGFSIPKPLDGMTEIDWDTLTTHVIIQLNS